MTQYLNGGHALQPHTLKMRDRANELWAQAACMADANECAQSWVYDPFEICELQDMAADLERYSIQPITFALSACPVNDDGSYLQDYCKCVLPEQSCFYCREAARQRAASEPEELEYTPDVWVNNFMSKVDRKVEMSRP